jgi:hypothetical protein
MAATFDPTLPTKKDHIRLALGDAHANAESGPVADALLPDELISATISIHGYSEALAQLADSLVARFAQQPDYMAESGGVTVRWSERISVWKSIAERARAGQIPDPTSTIKKNTARIAVGKLAAQSAVDTRFRSD